MATKREALISSAEKSLQKGKVDAALRDYIKVLEETPNDINILNKVGDLQVRLGKNDESIPFFLRIAEHYARDGFYVRAIAMYKKINKLDPARLDIYEKLAELYVKQQLWMEAKSNYQVLADYLLKQDNLAGTIGIYQKMVAIEPQNLQLHVKLADLFTQAKRIPEGLREYGVVAAALSERGAHEEAIRVYEKALKLAPDNVDILRALVPLLLSINSIDQARSALRKGLEASPRSVPLFLLSAEAALAANDMAEARSYSEKARAVDPENEDVLAAAVRIQLKGRRPDLAWAAAAPLAEAAIRRGETKKALALLVPIARAAPDSDEIVRKIVEIAAGAGDEATALPFRSALAELYRKKGKVAEASDLLRHCSRVQPDNAEFRARLAQLEPQSSVAPAAPARVPPPTLERHMEVSLSGFEGQQPQVPAPPVPQPPPVVEPAAAAEMQEFEFDLDDAEMIEAPAQALPAELPAAPVTPPRGLAARGREPVAPPSESEAEPAWGSFSAREALEAYEARESESAAPAPQAESFAIEEIEELQPGAEVEAAPPPVAPADEFPALELSLAPPDGFGPGFALATESFEVPPLASPDLPSVAWPSTVLPEAEPVPGEEEGSPSAFAPVSRPVSADTELDDALVEADVFRRYGLLEKAVEQLRPLLERSPDNERIREKLFEIHLEQGHRDEARAQAAILAEAYGVDGREDRIRGLEALLGEPLREVSRPEAEEPAPVEAVLAAAEIPVELVAAEPVAEPGIAEALDGETAEAEAIAPGLAAAELALDLAAVEFPPEEAGAVEAPSFVSAALGEPPTEVIASVVMPPPLPAEQVPEEIPGAEGRPETELGAGAPIPEGPAPALGVSPGPESAPPAEPVAPAPPERRAASRPKITTEDLLGLGKAEAPPATKKVRAVRPEDVELDLLARTPKTKARPKAGPKAEPVLPDDLLRSLRKPAPTPHVAGPEVGASGLSAESAAFPTAPASASEAAGAEGTAAPLPVAATTPVEEPLPAPDLAPRQPSAEELAELDFCLDQGMVVDAAERLQSLEGHFPGDGELAARRMRLEGGRGATEATRAALHDILSDDLDSVLDASLGRALTEDMVRESPEPSLGAPSAAAGAPVLDESGLFSDEQEFFNFADELHSELKRESVPAIGDEGREVSLEEIFRDFKRGVEQQLSPEDFETHYNLGIAYKEMGLTDEAIGEFQLAAKDPLHAVECCSMLGLCFLEKGLPQLAVKWYRKGLETIGVKEDDRLGLLYALAGILEQVGDREGAYRTYLDIYGTSAGYRDVSDRLKELKPFAPS